MIGARLPRKEDPRLLTGQGRFGDDVACAGGLWARVVRSPVAYGRLLSVDVPAVPGLTRVITAADLPVLHRIPVRLAVDGPVLDDFLQPVLASDVVRYVGEPVAVVVGDDPYACEDAAELVSVDIDPLPAVTDAARGQVAATLTAGYGDVDAAFAAAAHVVTADLAIGRHSGVPLEPRCLVAIPRPDGGLDIHGMTKVPVFNRDLLARMLGIDQALIHVHAVDAGGGFGVRGEFYPEDFLIPWLAMTGGRPVRWTEDRAEHLVAVNHSRQQAHTVSAAFDADGNLLALADQVLHDNGAYCRTHGVAVPELTISMLPGPYRVPAYRGRIDVALTNKTPCGTYRAPGRFEGTAAREHLLDIAAGQLGIDPVELRRQNLLTPADMPHRRAIRTLGTDLILDTGDYPGLLAAAVAEAEKLGYFERSGRLGQLAGTGLAMFVEKSGLGPRETADVTLTPAGQVNVYAGGTSLGQGIETVLAQIAADVLEVPLSAVNVVTGDTDLQPLGTGSWASRSTVVSGSAVHLAALAVKAKMGTEASAGDITARHTFETAHMTYPYGVHIAAVEVDPGTGQVRVTRYLVAYEVGRAINPQLVEGQLRGGVAQGIGGALFEEFSYDEDGQPLAISFMDYRMPTAAEIPAVDILLKEDARPPGNPLGVMGAGEGGVSAAGAAIANAVRDALGLTGTVGRLPLTPARIMGLVNG
jgi:carbon-monoxide dehydrogenase large subunit/6-hydroxypseudooxynicotine dehydrogenase subunit gamma